MKKVFKFIKISIFSIFFIFIIFLSICAINNQLQFKKEANILTPTGKLVDVNNHKMHVYCEGKGELTCVFMSGLGNAAPYVELKSLYKNMSYFLILFLD